jgi:hypothetical protein
MLSRRKLLIPRNAKTAPNAECGYAAVTRHAMQASQVGSRPLFEQCVVQTSGFHLYE